MEADMATSALPAPSLGDTTDYAALNSATHSIPPNHAAASQKPSREDSQNSTALPFTASKTFPRLQVSSSDISQSTLGEALERDMTPPSSSSTFSSQEQALQLLQYSSLKPYRPATDETMYDAAETRMESMPVENDVAMDGRESVQSSRSGSSVELAPGQKRTASGVVKPANAPEQTPEFSKETVHAQNASADSANNKMAELSSQLRTRLSYAMVKVQHGWQSHSLDEVESLASQHASSPTTTSTTTFTGRRPPFTSPRTEMAANLRRQWSGSSDGTTGTRDFATHPTKHINGTIQTGSRQAASPYTSALRAQETYPRQSSPNSAPRLNQAYHTSQKRSLAPPADIVPSSRRRPAHITTDIPTSNPQSYPAVIPATPPPHLQPPVSTKQRTPSQNRMMEQDAIETLLFMSSPGNSGYRPNPTDPSSTLTSPMRSQFSITERRVGFAEGTIDSSSEEGRKHERSGQASSGLSRQVDDLDLILDEMDDEGSSDGEEAVVPRQAHVVHT